MSYLYVKLRCKDNTAVSTPARRCCWPAYIYICTIKKLTAVLSPQGYFPILIKHQLYTTTGRTNDLIYLGLMGLSFEPWHSGCHVSYIDDWILGSAMTDSDVFSHEDHLMALGCCGTHSTKNLWASYRNLAKMQETCAYRIPIRSHHNSAHATTA